MMTFSSDSVDMYCSCAGYLVILDENYKSLCTKSRTEIEIKGLN